MTKVILHDKLSSSEKLISSNSAYSLVKGFYELFDDREMFSMFVLNNRLNPLAWEMISVGGVTGCVVDPKIIFRRALAYKTASKLMVFHNHPSGSLTPSKSDIEITKKLIKGGMFLEMSLVDHIIVTSSDYYSMRDNSTLSFE